MKPGDIVKIPTGVKSYFEDDEVLMIFVRSSTGFKYNIRMVNQVGIIDADYYNNKDNEGHMYIKLQNEGDKTVSFKKGDHLAQGIFMKYLTIDDDEGNDKERRTSY
jgi:dUTP pyrophosphatase